MTKEKKKVWIFTFEYAGIVKVGGLGEVPANQAKYLKKDFEVNVFIPSHGQLERLKEITDFLNIKVAINSEENGEVIIPLQMGIEKNVDLNEDGEYQDITLEYLSIHSSSGESETKDLVKIKVRKFPGDEWTTDNECDDEDPSTNDVCGRSPYKMCLHIPQ